MVENHILFHSFVKTLTYIYSYSSYLLDMPRQQIQYEKDYVEKGLLWTKLFGNSLRTKCTYVWIRLRACAAPSVNGSNTICHKPNLLVFCANTKGILHTVQTGFFMFANRTLVTHIFCIFSNTDWSMFLECALKL